MKPIRLRPPAQDDIGAIADYTIKLWGAEQARKYLTALRADIESLGTFSARFPHYGGRAKGLRQMPSGHHLVLYRIETDHIDVVRILHERMNLLDYL